MNQAKMQNMAGFAGGGPVNLQQTNPDVQNNSITRFIMQSLNQQPAGVGWRAQVGIHERMLWIKQMYDFSTATYRVKDQALTCVLTSIDSLRLLPQPVNDIAKVARIAVQFEQKAFNEANEKVGKVASFA